MVPLIVIPTEPLPADSDQPTFTASLGAAVHLRADAIIVYGGATNTRLGPQDWPALAQHLARIRRERPADPSFVVAADLDVAYGRFARVLSVASAHFQQLSFVRLL